MEEYLLSVQNKFCLPFDKKYYYFYIEDLPKYQKINIDFSKILILGNDCYNSGKRIGESYFNRCGFARYSSNNKNDVLLFIIGFLSTIKSTR